MLQTAKEFEKKFTTLPSLQIDSVSSGGTWDFASHDALRAASTRKPQDGAKYKLLPKILQRDFKLGRYHPAISKHANIRRMFHGLAWWIGAFEQ